MEIKKSISTGFFSDLSPEECVKELAAAGFQYAEFGLEHGVVMLEGSQNAEKLGRDLAKVAADQGLSFRQGHLDMDLDLCDPGDRDRLKLWLDLFQALGIRSAVLHATGVAQLPLEQQLEVRAPALADLAKHIAGTGMTICLENLVSNQMVRVVDGILTLLEAAGNGPELGICLDIGHLRRARGHGLTEQTSREFIQKAGKRLKALHVHDNMGVNDDHLFPFCTNGLDWQMFMLALEENGYRDLFNLELPGESHAPLAVRRQKLAHGLWLCDYLSSPEFMHC